MTIPVVFHALHPAKVLLHLHCCFAPVLLQQVCCHVERPVLHQLQVHVNEQRVQNALELHLQAATAQQQGRQGTPVCKPGNRHSWKDSGRHLQDKGEMMLLS
jgi:hypothetical protein